MHIRLAAGGQGCLTGICALWWRLAGTANQRPSIDAAVGTPISIHAAVATHIMILLIYGFSISRHYLLPAEYNEKPGTRFFKWADDLNAHFSKAIIDGQWACEKLFKITNYQGHAKQNHNELSPHICRKGYHQNVYR